MCPETSVVAAGGPTGTVDTDAEIPGNYSCQENFHDTVLFLPVTQFGNFAKFCHFSESNFLLQRCSLVFGEAHTIER